MSNNAQINLTLLEEVNQETLDYLNTLEIELETVSALEKRGTYIYKIILASNFLIICEEDQNEERVAAIIRLRFSLKLSKIQVEIEQQTQNNRKNTNNHMFVGFTIINEVEQAISFYLQSSSDLQLWYSHLSKHLTQRNFIKQFKILNKLGKGHAASVYQCIRKSSKERFAVKVYSLYEIKSNQKWRKTFQKELCILRELHEAKILIFEGFFQDETNFYLVMQKLNGKTLYNFLSTRSESLSLSQTKSIFKGLLENSAALAKLNIIHRDIKLENIVFKDKFNTKPTFIDYQYAIHVNDDDYGYYRCGTPGYLSPEVIKNKQKEKLTTKNDVFSLGCIFHVLLTGKFIFKGKDAKQIYKNNKALAFDLDDPSYDNIDGEALDLLKKMVEADPQYRYSAQQCLEHNFFSEREQEEEEARKIDRKKTIQIENGDLYQLLV